jgi:uncharacterized integral membrane protein
MPEPAKHHDGRAFRLSPRIVVGAIIAVLALVFIFQNTTDTRVHLLFWNVDRPAWLWLLIVFAAGFVVGSIYPWFRHRQKRASASPPSGPN